ncbi:redox-sensing transcriptional repressor Rex [Planctomycetota bacterium]
MKTDLPISTISRLCMVYQLCGELEQQGAARVSSSEIGCQLDVAAHTIRKDFNHLGEMGMNGAGYEVAHLQQRLSDTLGLDRIHRACIVGLGRLGSAILAYAALGTGGFAMVAGFDASINRLETLATDVPVYPAYDIEDVVRREAIEMAIIAVPREAAQSVADALVSGGVRGMVNFAPVVIKPTSSDVVVRNINVVNEMRMLASMLTRQALD